jgi:hypothetical protein
VSEYQYYEFQTVDRPLTEKEMNELRALSSRAEITRTSFSNEYNYGDFRGDANAVLAKYFDAFVYIANWGTRRLMLRLPGRLVDTEVLQQYCVDEFLSAQTRGDFAILEFRSETEDHEWEQGEGWLDELIDLRSELLAGDYRSLYLGWLNAVGSAFGESDEEDEYESFNEEVQTDTVEPPVPPGLAKLSEAQKKLAEFLRIDQDLIEATAEGSTGKAPAGPARDELADWAQSLPETEKTKLLVSVLSDESPLLKAELLQRFLAEQRKKTGRASTGQGNRRTIGQLLAARDTMEKRRKEAAAKQRAAEKAQREREEAAARTRRLDALAQRESAAWSEADTLVASKLPKNYDQALALLKDLHALAERSGKVDEAMRRLQELRARHASKHSMMKRLDNAGL